MLELHRLSAESLAGRIQLYHLSAFSLAESVQFKLTHPLPETWFDIMHLAPTDESAWHHYSQTIRPFTQDLKQALFELLIWGGLPEVLQESNEEERLNYLGNYLQTYLEKDVRAIESITDITLYRRLMDISAEQTGSIRDDTKMVHSLSCHRDTLNKYRSYLAATLMYQDIQPYIHSTMKRLVKSPKGYLMNNGLISYLTGLYELQTLIKTGQISHRLENWFLNELQIWLNLYPARQSIHFWRTSTGVEVDFIVNKPPYVFPFEVTFSSLIETKKVKNLIRFLEDEPKATMGYYIYMGEFKWDAKLRIAFIPAWMV